MLSSGSIGHLRGLQLTVTVKRLVWKRDVEMMKVGLKVLPVLFASGTRSVRLMNRLLF
jgi:hypothetical protein